MGTDGEVTGNAGLADRLAELAALLRSRKGDRFRVRAYERAAETLRAAPVDVAALDPAEMVRLDGVGAAIAGIVGEYHRTGRIALLDELRTGEPPGFGALLRLPLIGVRDARALAGVHGFHDLATLRAAARTAGGLDGVGDRLAGRVRESLRRLDAVAVEGLPLPLARRSAASVGESLAALPGVREVLVAGSIRRASDTVGGFDIVLVGERPAEIAEVLPTSRAVVRVLEPWKPAGPARVLAATGRRADLWLADPEGAGAALVHATGSPAHVAALRARAAERGRQLRPDGIRERRRRVAGATEAEVYGALGLPLVPPELREGAGEVEAASEGRLPDLVDLGHLRGDLHVHSDWSGDGRDSLERMVRAAGARGYAYVAITDHAENLTINGMSRERVLARRRAIAELQERVPQVRILDAAELNIGLHGSLDYDPDFLLGFDLTVASVHSHMDRPAFEQTERILAAIAHPAVTIIGHPTGRILGHRPGYPIEVQAIAEAAAETGTALEVNGSPRRLDLAAGMIRGALDAGATLALSSDAHHAGELDYVGNAVPTARRGWAGRSDVLNCGGTDHLLAFADRKRSR